MQLCSRGVLIYGNRRLIWNGGRLRSPPPRGFLTPIPVGERENILRVSPDPNQQRSAGGVITAGVHVSGTRPLSSFLQHPPEDTRTQLCDLRHAKKMRHTAAGCHLNVKRVFIHMYKPKGPASGTPRGGGWRGTQVGKEKKPVWKDFLSNNCGINWNIRHKSDINDSPFLIRTFSFNPLLLKAEGGVSISYGIIAKRGPISQEKPKAEETSGSDYLVWVGIMQLFKADPSPAVLVFLSR